MFPKAIDYHKPDKPLVPNGLGVIYVLASAVYLFLLYFLLETKHIKPPGNLARETFSLLTLALAVCILFGGFMGLLDDWMDLRWRYKAFLPLLAAIPLVALRQGTPVMDIPILGKINFAAMAYGYIYFYVLVIPGIVTVTTNTINQLGGLNGLETVCPSIIMLGLMVTSRHRILLYVPIVVYAILAYFNFRGKIFVGNTGSFAIGITLASFAIIANDEKVLLVSILPYLFNSSILLFNRLFLRRRTTTFMKENRLHAKDRRSLLTIIEYYHPSTERQLVGIVSLIVGLFVLIAVLMWLTW